MIRLLEMTYDNLVELFAQRYGKKPFLAGALYREFYKGMNPCAWTADAIGRSPGLAGRLEKDLACTPGTIVDAVHQEGVIKFITALSDGHRIESVLLPMTSHHTLCVSSQVGCRMGCRFCETAKLGLVRDLTVEEITGQVYSARMRYGQPIRNVVFMGMGEPFDNFDAVVQAIRVLSDQRGMDIARRYITVSTAGRIDGIRRLARLDMPHLKLAVSLNAANDALRDRLMPINRRSPLARLQAALMAYPLKKGYALMVAYVLIPGCERYGRLRTATGTLAGAAAGESQPDPVQSRLGHRPPSSRRCGDRNISRPAHCPWGQCPETPVPGSGTDGRLRPTGQPGRRRMTRKPEIF